mmetsp:Transcript_6830/g.9382  ORF Transcript_6830/g.9382 Transcript_6830/m.9382 type:complete len:1068 (+) Transcript_6830:15710-18913(+)
MINYFGDKDSVLNVGLPDGSGICDPIQMSNNLIDVYLDEFIDLLFHAAYKVPNTQQIDFEMPTAPAVGLPAYPDATRAAVPDEFFLTHIPFIQDDYFDRFGTQSKLFRPRMPKQTAQGHMPSRFLYDNVFKYFVEWKFNGATPVPQEAPGSGGGEIKDSRGETLVKPEREVKSMNFTVGIENPAGTAYKYPVANAAGDINGASIPNRLKMLNRNDVEIPLSDFVPDGAFVFTLYCAREQMLREDPGIYEYNMYKKFYDFFLALGFQDGTPAGREFINNSILDPDRPIGKTHVAASVVSHGFEENLYSLLMQNISNGAVFDSVTYNNFVSAGLSDDQIVVDILNAYDEYRNQIFNEVANCVFRYFGWRGNTFSSVFVAKGDNDSTFGLLNVRNAGQGLVKYEYGNGITVPVIPTGTAHMLQVNHPRPSDNPTIVEFQLTEGDVSNVHWSFWGFNPGNTSQGGSSDITFKVKGYEDYTVRAKDEGVKKSILIELNNELFYPLRSHEDDRDGTWPDGTWLNRITDPSQFRNRIFKWRKEKLFLKKDPLVAIFDAKSQTMSFEKDIKGTLRIEVGGTKDEIFGIITAFEPDGVITTTDIITAGFALDLYKTYRDDHFVLTNDLHGCVWSTAEDIANIDAITDFMLSRHDDISLGDLDLKPVIAGNGIGIRPRPWILTEEYHYGELVIVEIAVGSGKFNVYRRSDAASETATTTFDSTTGWTLVHKHYNTSASGYEKGDIVVYNSTTDVLQCQYYIANENMSSVPPLIDFDKWERIPIVVTDGTQTHFHPPAIDGRSDHLKDHHARLRYSFLGIKVRHNEIVFNADAWVSPIRSRLDRMYRNYGLLDDNVGGSPGVLNLESDINGLTFYDPSQDVDGMGVPIPNPSTNVQIPYFPNEDYELIEIGTTDPVITTDARTYAPTTNNDYPHEGDDEQNVNGNAHSGYTPGGEWIPIYNPLLSFLRAMTILEEGADSFIKRADERLLLAEITTEQRDFIFEKMTDLKLSSMFEVVVWDEGYPVVIAVDYLEFCRLKIQPTCPEELPDDLSPGDFTSALPSWTHGFNDDATDPCSPL